jgi:hypothetical protein
MNTVLSCVKGSYSLTFEKGALLSIGNYCRAELNMLEGSNAAGRGMLKKLSIGSHGILNIEKEGLLLIGPNTTQLFGDRRGKEAFLCWDNCGGIIKGEGCVQVGGTSFIGHLQQRTFYGCAYTAESLVRNLVGIYPQLSASTIFYDKAGERVLYTKNGVIVSLTPDEAILSDDEQGNVTFYNNKSLSYGVINAYGERVPA